MESEGWIKHDGGPCPVDKDAAVYIRMADDHESEFALSAGGFGWQVITAYRLAEPQAHMMSAPEYELDEALAAAIAAIPEDAETPYGSALRQIADLEAERDQLKESLREMTFFKNIWLQVAKDYARAIEGYRDGHKRSRDPVQPGNVSRANAGLLVVAPLTPLLGKGNDEEGTPSKPRPVFSWGNPV
jgi:hypothetical protein